MDDGVHSILLLKEGANGKHYQHRAKINVVKNRIEFLSSPFALKDEIKAMKGSRWHGFDKENPRKIWSISKCARNLFQLYYMMGQDVYAWFDRPLVKHQYDAPLMLHQEDMCDHGLTYHFQIWGAEMGTGKTLAAQKLIEMSGKKHWYWVGPKRSLVNIEAEFRKWGFDFTEIKVEFMSYEKLVVRMDLWGEGDDLPDGVIFDESSKLKNHTSQRTKAAQMLADMIRAEHGMEGFVILMSGTPAPKSPMDWWSQCEIAWPGFLREGSPKALEERLAVMEEGQIDGMKIKKRIAWKDQDGVCDKCGCTKDEGEHEFNPDAPWEEFHKYVPCRNEVAFLYERMKGLVLVKFKKDVMSLPDKRYRTELLKPAEDLRRTAQTLVKAAPNVITGMTWLRELSDGFVYKTITTDKMMKCQTCDGTGKVQEWKNPVDDRKFSTKDLLDPEFAKTLVPFDAKCPNCKGKKEIKKKERVAREIPCPKEDQLKLDLDACEETGRVVIFAGFTGSLERISRICQKEGWAVWLCDGRGNRVFDEKGTLLTNADALKYWADQDSNPKVAFVAHPESGGMSFTLTQSRMAIFWSNSFKPEYRVQAEDRIHRKGMDENLGCEIVDYIHLNTDNRVLNTIRENRRIELMTLGDIATDLEEPVELV